MFGAGRIEIQVEAEFRQRLQGESDEEAVFFYPTVVADDGADGGDPAREIAIDRVALLFQHAGDPFVLLLNADPPVVVDAIIATEDVEAAVVEERIGIEIAMRERELKVGDGLNVTPVFTSVKPFSKTGTCDKTEKVAQGTGEKLKLLNRFEYWVWSNGLSKFTSM